MYRNLNAVYRPLASKSLHGKHDILLCKQKHWCSIDQFVSAVPFLTENGKNFAKFGFGNVLCFFLTSNGKIIRTKPICLTIFNEIKKSSFGD